MPQREFKGEQGFITFALGEKYLKLAYVQALSIKLTQKIKNYAVIVDKTTAQSIDTYKHVFDYVKIIDYVPSDWDMTQHYKTFALTPWRETILLDADIVFTNSIDHWWHSLRHKDVCLTSSVKDFKENIITSRACRKLFDENLLPDVYAGFTYFRYSQFASDFFNLLKVITENWNWIAKEHLIKNQDYRFRIDEAFALATRIMGKQHVTLPVSIPTFIHCKSELWNLNKQQPWYEQLYVEWDNFVPLIGHYHQRLPLHYHNKEWITNDIIQRYEQYYREFSKGFTGV